MNNRHCVHPRLLTSVGVQVGGGRGSRDYPGYGERCDPRIIRYCLDRETRDAGAREKFELPPSILPSVNCENLAG